VWDIWRQKYAWKLQVFVEQYFMLRSGVVQTHVYLFVVFPYM